MVKRCGHHNKVGFQVFWKKFFGHVVLVNAPARGLAPAREAADAVVDLLLLQVHDIDFSAGLSHPLDEMIEYDFRLALFPNPGTRVDGHYLHVFLPLSGHVVCRSPYQKSSPFARNDPRALTVNRACH
jgi:hypothetical protein